MDIKIESPAALEEAAARFVEAVGDKRHFAFRGEMGVGKTTFISALCKVLGMVDEASSPTFSIVNEYWDGEGKPAVYHFDFYRIESPEEAMDLGLDNYYESGCWCLMEWPERVDAFLPDDVVDVTLREEEDGSRVLHIEGD